MGRHSVGASALTAMAQTVGVDSERLQGRLVVEVGGEGGAVARGWANFAPAYVPLASPA